MDRILIVAARGGAEHGGAEIYAATSTEEAEDFVALWNEAEQNNVLIVGGYPGEAYVIGEELPAAADWLAEQEA